MGNKSRIRVGVRAGLTWAQCKQRFPAKFAVRPNYLVAPPAVGYEQVTISPTTKRHYREVAPLSVVWNSSNLGTLKGK